MALSLETPEGAHISDVVTEQTQCCGTQDKARRLGTKLSTPVETNPEAGMCTRQHRQQGTPEICSTRSSPLSTAPDRNCGISPRRSCGFSAVAAPDMGVGWLSVARNGLPRTRKDAARI